MYIPGFDPSPQDLLWRAARDLSSLSRADLPLRPRRPVKGAPQRGHTDGELRSAVWWEDCFPGLLWIFLCSSSSSWSLGLGSTSSISVRSPARELSEWISQQRAESADRGQPDLALQQTAWARWVEVAYPSKRKGQYGRFDIDESLSSPLFVCRVTIVLVFYNNYVKASPHSYLYCK